MLTGREPPHHRAAAEEEQVVVRDVRVVEALVQRTRSVSLRRRFGAHRLRYLGDMTAVGIASLVSALLTAAFVGFVFWWAAKKDGEYDKAVQRRLGIRRRTRLGR